MTKIVLNTPIKTSDGEITEFTLTKPTAGQLRGIKLFELVQGDTSAYIEMLPRVTKPAINKAQASSLDLSDFVQLIEVVSEWFAGKTANTQAM